MRMKLSGLSLCKAGDWGVQTPEKIVFVVFFAATPQKNTTKRGLGLCPNGKYALASCAWGYRFCGYAAKTIPPIRMGWHALACIFRRAQAKPTAGESC
jgi:hypothetical protein